MPPGQIKLSANPAEDLILIRQSHLTSPLTRPIQRRKQSLQVEHFAVDHELRNHDDDSH